VLQHDLEQKRTSRFRGHQYAKEPKTKRLDQQPVARTPMQKPPLAPDVADTTPSDSALAVYDEKHVITYLRLLDAEAEGPDWREVARGVLRLVSPRVLWAQGTSRRSSAASNGYHKSSTPSGCYQPSDAPAGHIVGWIGEGVQKVGSREISRTNQPEQ
jgi:hypothetical protein